MNARDSGSVCPRLGALVQLLVHCTVGEKKFDFLLPGQTCACVMMSRKPIFCVVLRHGELWQVEAEWPDGTIEPIDKFKAHYEALQWVRTHSAAWIEERIPTSQVAAYQ
jgi:hypothetical protein